MQTLKLFRPTYKSQLDASKGTGSPLPKDVRTSMESAFGVDLSNVRVHTNCNAVQMNQELNAQAFTHGSDIYFNKGKYNPAISSGKQLLTHELTHVIQQERRSTSLVQRQVPDAGTGPSDGGVPAGVPEPAEVESNVAKEREERKVGKHEGQRVGTWGIFAKTPLTTGKREKEDFATQEAAIAYARGMGKATAVFKEEDMFVVYPIMYSWWSGFSSFTYAGTRMYRRSKISDVMGVPGVLAFVTEDGVAILPNQYGGENDYTSWMEQQDVLRPDINPFDSHKEAFGEGLGKITGKDKFLEQFKLAMRDAAIQTLDRSKVEAQQKQRETSAH